MAEISDEELAELRSRAARTDAAEQTAKQASEPAPREQLVPHRALLADGTVHDYAGAHPTQVSKPGPDGREQLVPVLAVYPA